ncbi:hypothetical protein V6N12_024464 [Hibiscus sabdariffa]|uniref:Uncharacterized protein n=1 Tax=Hibiscus sabdariffa TaxID=183260 RepID=A0ABR2G0M5_9ROSI
MMMALGSTWVSKRHPRRVLTAHRVVQSVLVRSVAGIGNKGATDVRITDWIEALEPGTRQSGALGSYQMKVKRTSEDLVEMNDREVMKGSGSCDD